MTMPHLIIDAHQDLAWNALTFGRNVIRSATETRRYEKDTGSLAPHHNGDTLLGWSDYQLGRVGIVFGTLYASPARHKMGDWDKQFYKDFDEARIRYMAQVDYYHRLVDENPDKFCLIQTRTDLNNVLACWGKQKNTNHETRPVCPVGLVILMEGAEGVREPVELEEWWARGVRFIGPAWAGTRFCGGTREPGPLTKDGYALLDGMASFGFTLDLSHMDEQAVLQALDYFPGMIIASHANAFALLKDFPTNRHLSDHVIRGIVARDGVIGVVPANGFLKVGWRYKSGSRKEEVTLEHVVAQIDYICQLAGDAKHVGIGSDFDGGFGLQAVPAEINTIADLQKLAPILMAKGYDDDDIASIFGLNWQGILEKSLPH